MNPNQPRPGTSSSPLAASTGWPTSCTSQLSLSCVCQVCSQTHLNPSSALVCLSSMAIAQPHTPGLTQSILNLLGIPLVLLFVWMFLRRAPSGLAAAGAALIIVGTATSALRAVPGVIHEKDDSAPIKAEWWAVISYAIAQLFLSGEKVFEEHTFTKFRSLDPLVMFAWTLTTQFILGWALLPVQTVPALGVRCPPFVLCFSWLSSLCHSQHTRACPPSVPLHLLCFSGHSSQGHPQRHR